MNKPRIRRTVDSVLKNIKVAWPPTLVIVILTLSSYYIFGVENMGIGPFMALTFIRTRNNDSRIGFLFRNTLIYLLLALFAYIAMKSLLLCLLSNCIAVFWICMALINRFQPKNYIPYGLALIIFQLSPVETGRLPVRLLSILFSSAVIYVAALIIYRSRPLTRLSELSNEGLTNSATLFESLSSGNLELIMDSRKNLFDTVTDLCMEIYTNNYSSFFNYGSSAYYYQFVRSFGDILNLSNPLWFTRLDLNKNEEEYLLNVGAILRGAANAKKPKEKYKMAFYLSELAEKCPFRDEQLRKYVSFMLDSLVNCLFDITRARWKYKKPKSKRWYGPTLRNSIEIKKRRFTTDSFELRFALRQLLVILPSFAFAYLSNNSYSYWLPLSLFLLVLPLYDDSFKRARSRVIGTVIGLLASYFIFTIYPSEISHYIVMVIAYFFIYFSSSIYTVQVVFITISVIAMNQVPETLTMFGQRLIYTLVAAAAAIIANRFFLPTSNTDEIKTTLSRLILIDYEIALEVLDTRTGSDDSFLIRELKLRSYLVTFKLKEHLKLLNNKEAVAEIEKFVQLNNHFLTGITHIYTIIRNKNFSELYREELNKHIKNLVRCLDYIRLYAKGSVDKSIVFFKASVYKEGYNTILVSDPYLNTHLYICEKYVYGMLNIIEKIDIIIAERG